MKAKIGSFLFRYRNAMGPFLFLLALFVGQPAYPLGRSDLNIFFDVTGAILALLGQALRILTIGYEYIERGGRNRQVYASKLVQNGVFAHCRNPMYVGNILMTFGFALIVNSYAVYLIVIPFVLFSYMSIVATEESFLRNKFGMEYDRYCQRVNRWWPRWNGWKHSIDGMHFNWSRVLIKEYNTIFVATASLVSLRILCEYRILGSVALPRNEYLVTGSVAWLTLYIVARSLKKTGYVKA